MDSGLVETLESETRDQQDFIAGLFDSHPDLEEIRTDDALYRVTQQVSLSGLQAGVSMFKHEDYPVIGAPQGEPLVLAMRRPAAPGRFWYRGRELIERSVREALFRDTTVQRYWPEEANVLVGESTHVAMIVS